jgi:hypothetical protein
MTMRDKDNNLVFYKETEENRDQYSQFATKTETRALPFASVLLNYARQFLGGYVTFKTNIK